jgi:hypothetical protein
MQMDESAEGACFVLGVSCHYADTFSQCGHFFGAHAGIYNSLGLPGGTRGK